MSKFDEKTVKSIVFKDVKNLADQAESTIQDLHRATLAACINNVEDTMGQVLLMFSKTGDHYKKRQILSNARYLAKLWKDGEKVYLDKEGKKHLVFSKIKTVADLPSNIDALRKYNKALYKEPQSQAEIAEDNTTAPETKEPEAPVQELTVSETIISLFTELLESDFASADDALTTMFTLHGEVTEQAKQLTA